MRLQSLRTGSPPRMRTVRGTRVPVLEYWRFSGLFADAQAHLEHWIAVLIRKRPKMKLKGRERWGVIGTESTEGPSRAASRTMRRTHLPSISAPNDIPLDPHHHLNHVSCAKRHRTPASPRGLDRRSRDVSEFCWPSAEARNLAPPLGGSRGL